MSVSKDSNAQIYCNPFTGQAKSANEIQNNKNDHKDMNPFIQTDQVEQVDESFDLYDCTQCHRAVEPMDLVLTETSTLICTRCESSVKSQTVKSNSCTIKARQ